MNQAIILDKVHVTFSPGELISYRNDFSPSIQQGMSTLSISEMCALGEGESQPVTDNERVISVPGFNLTCPQITLRHTQSL